MKYKRSQIIKEGNRDTFVQWAFINLISNKGFPNKDEEQWHGLPTAKEIDISVVIEGVEVDFLKMCECIEKHMEELESGIEDRAKELAIGIVQEHFHNTMDLTSEILKTVEKEQIAWIMNGVKS